MTTRNRGPAATRRQVLAGLAGASLVGLAGPARPQAAWRPASPVKIVVPYPPGGTADLLARIVAPAMAERLGQPVVVENRPGATGSIGTDYAYAAPGDGTVLLLGVADPLSIYPHLVRTSRSDVTKLVPVAGLATTGFVLMGRPDLPAANLQELIALARRQSLSCANAGTGSSPHMVSLAFAQSVKVDKLLQVPYQGTAPLLQALLARQVDMSFVALGVAGPYKSRLKMYGVASANRMPTMPDVPSFTEQGVPLVAESWQGIIAPPNTPANVTAALARVVQDIVNGAEFKARVAEQSLVPLPLALADFANYYAGEHRKWGELVRIANVKLD